MFLVIYARHRLFISFCRWKHKTTLWCWRLYSRITWSIKIYIDFIKLLFNLKWRKYERMVIVLVYIKLKQNIWWSSLLFSLSMFYFPGFGSVKEDVSYRIVRRRQKIFINISSLRLVKICMQKVLLLVPYSRSQLYTLENNRITH